MPFLDPRFRLVAALIDDPTCSAEVRSVARQQAEGIAAACGFTFADALWHVGVRLPEATLPFVAPPLPSEDGRVVGDAPAGDVLREGHETLADANAVICRPTLCDAVSPLSPDTPDGQIAGALKADPGRSDRDIARQCDASPTTVGKMRKALGLGKAVRTVNRGGVAYDMQVGGRA